MIKNQEKPHFDKSFDEALLRLAQTDPKELAHLIKEATLNIKEAMGKGESSDEYVQKLAQSIKRLGSPREPGFYWVRDGGGWSVAEWRCFAFANTVDAFPIKPEWYVPGNECGFQDDEFDEIGERVALPSDLP